EAPADGHLLEEAALLALPARSAGLLRERDVAEDEPARIAHGEARRRVGQEVRNRVQALLLPEREHGLVHEPERHLAGKRLPPRVLERDLDGDRLARPGARRVLERHVDAVVDRVHLDPRGRGDRRRLPKVQTSASHTWRLDSASHTWRLAV